MVNHPIPINIYRSDVVQVGDKFTIAGIKVIGKNRYISNCKPGAETEFIYADEPSSFVIAPVFMKNLLQNEEEK